MPRKLRLVYDNAVYHIVNRGYYRSDVFGTSGAAQAFEEVNFETVKRFGWDLHAYVLMRNHFHLAITTPKANSAPEQREFAPRDVCSETTRCRDQASLAPSPSPT